MVYTDYKQIESIKFKYPDLMSKDAEDLIKVRFNEINSTKESIAELNQTADELRNKLKRLTTQWESIQPLIEVTYKKIEKEEIKNKVNIGFNFQTEVNKNIH